MVEVLIVAARFEVIKDYVDKNINLPSRSTKYSAGYDFEVAEDTIIPSYPSCWDKLIQMQTYAETNFKDKEPYTFDEIATLSKIAEAKPTLVPTGIKCKLDEDTYLQLSVRSSCPLKSWLILANGIGIIDADYYGNDSNDGHIMFQIINLSPYDIKLKKGDKIGQGVILHYDKVENDNSEGERSGGFGSTSETK